MPYADVAEAWFASQDRFVFEEEWRRWRQEQQKVQGMSFAGSVTSVTTTI
jgi:hypothetical protein